MINLEYIHNYICNRANELLKWESNRIANKTDNDIYKNWQQYVKDLNYQFFSDVGVSYKFKSRLEKDYIIGWWQIQDRETDLNFGFQVCLDLSTIKQIYIPSL